MADPAIKSGNHEEKAYRQLQQHLDQQPVGFPKTDSGIELKVLQHIFTTEQASIATCLTHKAQGIDQIYDRARDRVASKEELEDILAEMVCRGGIETGKKNGKPWYRNAPLVVGMYEYQIERLSPEFIRDFAEYTATRKFGISYLSTKLPQIRTIPVNKSIQIKSETLDFNCVKDILDHAEPPFAICECICRKKQGLLGNSCKMTQRLETCMAAGHLAETALQIGMGREISLEEAHEILELNQKDGLVVQPSNSQKIDFICSCCGCCCGILKIHKKLPKPLDFWSANFLARIDGQQCTACGICSKKCQVDAVTLKGDLEIYSIDPLRCIGCGICVAACPMEAISLERKADEHHLPHTREELFDIIESSKKGKFGRALLTGKLVKDALLTGRLDILK